MITPWSQDGHRIRLAHGPREARELVEAAPHPVAAVVVDVLSFSTTVTVAADHGTVVVPAPWHGERARALAESQGLPLAVGRHEARDLVARGAAAPPVSLSPSLLRRVDPPPRVVLPSPNGATICTLLAGTGAEVVVAGLRNRTAVAARLLAAAPATIVLVAAGERWRDDDSLRPALEDVLGAAAVADALLAAGAASAGDLSPEARAALASFRDVGPAGLHAALRDGAGGRELAAAGFADDVEVAAELDTSVSVPVLERARGGWELVPR